jgi:hypothetical protein
MPFPAPLCGACNEPMKLKGEYVLTIDKNVSARREYQCNSCDARKTVRLSTTRPV